MKFLIWLAFLSIYHLSAYADTGASIYNDYARQLPVNAQSVGAQRVQYCHNLVGEKSCRSKVRVDIAWFQTFQISSQQCKQDLETKKCSQLVKANPEVKGKLRDCSPLGICLNEVAVYRTEETIKGCFWNAPQAFNDDIFKIITSVPGMMKDQYYKCYGNPKTIAERTYRSILCSLPGYYFGSAGRSVAGAVLNYSKIYEDGKNWVKNKNVEMQCFSPQAQTELICYGILNVIVPTHALKVKSPKWLKEVFAEGKTTSIAKPISKVTPPKEFGKKVVPAQAKPAPHPFREQLRASGGLPAKTTSKLALRLGTTSEMSRGGKGPSERITASESLIVAGTETAEKFKKRLLHYDPVKDADRIDLIKFVNTPAQRGSKIIDIENAALKDLNSLIDQDVVTALTNHHKALIQDKFKKLLEKYGDQLDYKQYSDFKSQRFALIPKNPAWKATGIPENVLKEFEQAYIQANKELTEKVKSMGLDKEIRAKMKARGTITDFNPDPNKWFKAGIDANADEANWNSRLSRNTDTEGFARSNNQEIAQAKTEVFNNINSAHQAVLTELGPSSPLLHKVDGVVTVKADVFDLIKKANSNPEEVKKSFKFFYPDAEVSDQAIKDLIKTAKLTDKIQPSIWQTTRTVSSVGDAKYGAISLDGLGLGSSNAEQALVQSVKCSSVNFLSACTRAGEREVTRVFQDNMKKISEVSLQHCREVKIKCSVTISGDDVRLVPLSGPLPEGFASNNLDRINQAIGSAKVRQAEIIADIPPAARVAIGQDGETIEKYFREKLRRSPLAEKSKQLTFSVTMKTAKVDTGAVKIEVTGTAAKGLTPAEMAEIQKLQKEALIDFNNSKSGRSYDLSN